MQAETAVEPLIYALNDPEYRARRGAAYALGQIGSERAWPALVSATEDTIWYAKNAALNALYKIDRDRSMDYIITALQNSTVNVRRQAVMVLLEDPHPARGRCASAIRR